jgi:hypothetical protein
MTATEFTTTPDFRYWNSVDPSSFLAHDWENPSRQWAAEKAIDLVGRGTIIEVGPGQGLDYERYFRPRELAAQFSYIGYEGSLNLCTALRDRYPGKQWHNEALTDIPPQSAGVVYVRHVLEHQPALEPALGAILAAARRYVVLTWYRQPAVRAIDHVWNGVHCQTYARSDVMEAVAAAGFRLAESQRFPSVAARSFRSGDECWVLERR